jgi:hypothetical protein
MRGVAVVLAVAASISACSAGSGSEEAGPRRDMNLITAEELAEVRVGTAYEAVEHLRAHWLRLVPSTSTADPTPQYAVVFLDNHVLGELTQLWTIALTDVREIRYLEPRESAIRFGMQYTSGIIQVITR